MTANDLIFYGCVVAAVILHEISHGIVALAFGDDTAKRAGRLTLNPLPHIDPVGSVLLPAMLVLAGYAPFGWAKPVPVNPNKLRNPRAQMLAVGLIGPITNFTLMAGAALWARANRPSFIPVTGIAHESLLLRIVVAFAFVNLFLGLFNLLPIPPLDGSSIIERLMPRTWLPRYWRIRPYGFLIIFAGVFMFHVFEKFVDPFARALSTFITG